MNTRIGSTTIAGLVGGGVLGAVLRVLPAAPLESGHESAALFLASAIHLPEPRWLWLALAGYGMGLGILFGWLLPEPRLAQPRAMLRGGLFGLGWGLVASVLIVPALGRMVPLSSPAIDLVRPDVLPLVVAHVIGGVVLGSLGTFLASWATGHGGGPAARIRPSGG